MQIFIKEIRNERGYSIDDLSKKTGISIGAISNYENKKRSPTLEQVRIFAIALNCKMSELYDCLEK